METYSHLLQIRVYLLHGPDDTVPFGEQMEALQRVYLDGKFDRLGLSNFSKDQVLEIYNYAKSRGYVLPSVYQSNYSLATRRLETELFPTLRELGMSFQAYSPMAAGFLAKTPEYIQKGLGSWNPNESYGKLLHLMFGKPSYMQMLAEFGKLSEDSGISRAGLAYRWVRHHSALDASLGDEMIIGAANAQQVEHTLEELDGGELEPWVVERIDELWEIVKADAPLGNNESAWQAFGPAA
jgi:aflatoxin B1 aldehyde reductase